MILSYLVITPLIYGLSILPFFILHFFSDVLCFWVYRVFGYRVKVVRENLKKSFPEKSDAERHVLEKKFYRNFCDLIFEVIKTFTISKKCMTERCVLTTPDLAKELWDRQVSVTGISSHLANWEWLAMSLSLEFKHCCYGVFKPLSNQYLNRMVVNSRQRFGIQMITSKRLREILQTEPTVPIVVGLLADQAPHHYGAAFEVPFLNQMSYVVPGPGVITVQKGYVPIWGWMRRTGRSRFEWGVEVLDFKSSPETLSDFEKAQVDRMAKHHALSLEQAQNAYALTVVFTQKLEEKIKMAPQDWLWSHRRWKLR